ncbi:hypothetical protein LTR62_008518 [Meristemomyces frigidus]|uniref:Uncharacterized protein n=1 Tax=Meristemomyces frigidus TaxID=1508187 RepID=A0AAN7YIL1_9PEZI|nr:hypothetical protein LTR62_008518 [Meristemomyces frigidus]
MPSEALLEVPRGREQRPNTNADVPSEKSRFEVNDSDPDLVTFTLSGSYDAELPILIDAENPTRFVSRRIATQLVDSLTGVFEPSSTNKGQQDILGHSKASTDDIVALMQTSGTTGLPKVATRTHRAMIHELDAIAGDDTLKTYNIRRLFCTPVFHAFSAPEMIFNALRLGRPSYFMRRFDDSFAHNVAQYHITETFGPPPMLLKLVNQPENYALLQSLRYVAYGGAPLGLELRRRFLDLFLIQPRLVPVYGMTEGGWYATFHYPEDDDTGSVGRSIPGYDIKINACGADDRTETPTGEILVRGPQMMQSYLGNEKATADVFEDGWLKTGDKGYMRDGKLYLIDRIKDLIKVNCWQVSPTELQNALLEHDAVAEAAVFAMDEGSVAEHPMVCVVTRSGCVLSWEEILRHLRERLAWYKVNYCELRFMKEIPKSATGKIMKRVLRERVLGGGDW